MPPRYHLDLTLEDDREAVQLRIVTEDRELFSARLEAPELDELIRALGQGRAQLADEVAPELDEGARIADTVIDPAYLVGRNSQEGRALIALRHPGYGWIGFQLHRPVAAAVARELGRGLGADS